MESFPTSDKINLLALASLTDLPGLWASPARRANPGSCSDKLIQFEWGEFDAYRKWAFFADRYKYESSPKDLSVLLPSIAKWTGTVRSLIKHGRSRKSERAEWGQVSDLQGRTIQYWHRPMLNPKLNPSSCNSTLLPLTGHILIL